MPYNPLRLWLKQPTPAHFASTGNIQHMANPAALQDKEHTRRLDRWLRGQAKTVKRPLNAAVMLGSVSSHLATHANATVIVAR